MTNTGKLNRVLSVMLSVIMIFGTVAVATPAFGNLVAKAASGDGLELEKGLVYDDDNNMTLHLESYVTGEQIESTITVAQPLDVVLVLDYSSSLYSSGLKALKNSAKAFVQSVAANSPNSRIGISTFADDPQTTKLIGMTPVSSSSSIIAAIDSLTKDGEGEYTDIQGGIFEGLKLYNEVTPLANAKKVMVVFTDGVPNSGEFVDDYYEYYYEPGSWYDTYENDSSYDARPEYMLHALAQVQEAKDKGFTVYTIGYDISSSSQFMKRLSSEYYLEKETYTYKWLGKEKTGYRTNEKQNKDGVKYYYSTSNSSGLSSVFTTISQQVVSQGASILTLGSETVLRDVITKDFVIRDSKANIKVSKVPCTGDNTWGTPVDITSQVTVSYNTSTQTAEVKGFDYSANWCGKRTDGSYGGYKLVVEIPIKTASGATGTGITTNTADSGVIAPGYTEPEGKFPVPSTDILTNVTVSFANTGYATGSRTFNITYDKFTGEYEDVNGYMKAKTVSVTETATIASGSNYTLAGKTVTGSNVTITETNLPTGTTMSVNGTSVSGSSATVTAADVIKVVNNKTTPNTVNVTFKNGSETLQTSVIDYNTKPSYTGATPVCTEAQNGYTYAFAGWTESEKAPGTAGSAYVTTENLPVATTDKTFYAYFTKTPVSYTVSYEGFDGKATITGGTASYDVTKTVTLPTVTPSVAYKFTGWTVKANSGSWTASSTKYEAGKNFAAGNYGNVTFVANFEEVKSGVKFVHHVMNANGVYEVKETSDSVVYTAGTSLTLASFAKANGTYEYCSYSYASVGGTAMTAYTVTASDAVIDLWYARAKTGTVTVKYVDAAGNALKTSAVAGDLYLGSVYTATAATIEGYSPDAATKNVTVTGANEVVFVYTPNNYTLKINYVYENGSEAATSVEKTLAFGTAFEETSPAITGYTANKPVVSGVIGVGGNEYTVTYTVNKHDLTVKYEFNDGKESLADTVKTDVAYNTDLSTLEIAIPTYVAYDVNIAKVTGNMPDSDYTVTVKYTRKVFTVTFKDYDGTVLGTQQVAYGDGAVTPTHPDRTGYDNNGWDKAFDNITSDVEITALYTIKKFTVTFMPGEKGEFTSANTEGNVVLTGVEYGTVLDASSIPTPVAVAGYTFTGYVPSVSGAIESDITFTAQYTPNTNTAYTVEYYFENVADSNFTKDDSKTVVRYGTTDTTATTEADAFTGFTFDSANANNVTSANIKGDGTTVLKLYYVRNTYDVVYVVNYNGTETTYATVSGVKYGSVIDLAKALPAEEGYSFGAWYSKDGTITVGDGNATVVTDKTANVYSISYTVSNGENNPLNPATYTVEDTVNLLPAVADTGYTFVGWTDGDGNTVTSIPAGTTGDIVLIAVVTPNDYVLTIQPVDEDGNPIGEPKEVTVKYDSEYSETVPSVPGYETVTEKVEGKMDEEGKTVTVVYTPIDYTLTVLYVFENGSQAAPDYTETVAYKAGYSVVSPEITHYTPDRATVTGTMAIGGVTETVVYSAIAYELVIQPVDEDGNKIGDPVVVDVPYGEDYEETAPTVPGYYTPEEPVKGTMDEEGKTVTVTYIKDPSQWATITYVVGNGEGEITGNATAEAVIGSTYSTSLRPEVTPSEGWMVSSWNNEPVVVEGDTTVTVDFAKDPAKWVYITYKYRGPLGIDKTVVQSYLKGTNYSESFRPSDVRAPKNMAFSHWDNEPADGEELINNVVITAVYKEEPQPSCWEKFIRFIEKIIYFFTKLFNSFGSASGSASASSGSNSTFGSSGSDSTFGSTGTGESFSTGN